jgi:hypothetical protein
MKSMNIPGFTAEDALSRTSGHYRTGRHAINSLPQSFRAIYPAAEMLEEVIVIVEKWPPDPWTPPFSGGHDGGGVPGVPSDPWDGGGRGGGGGTRPRPRPRPRPTPEASTEGFWCDLACDAGLAACLTACALADIYIPDCVELCQRGYKICTDYCGSGTKGQPITT